MNGPRVDVAENPGRRRFEVSVDGAAAGFLSYRPGPGRMAITHVEVDPAYEGQGLGGRLARTALEAARERGLAVEPACPFIRSWVDTNPGYADLLVPGAVDPSNTAQAESWDGPGGAYWAEQADAFDASISAYQEPYLDLAGIGPTDRLWDIGCGNGRTTRDAARRAPGGHAAGLDLSGAMLAVARRAAAAEGLPNVTFLQGDAQVHPFEPQWADLVISRTGSMFFGDPVAAFTNIRSGLRPGGRLALLVWQPLARNEWMLEIMRALLPPDAAAPAPGAPGPFALADPGRVREILVPAGFSDPELTPLEAPMTFGPGIEAAFRFIVGLAGWMTRDRPADEEAAAHAALRASLAAHVRADGVVAYGSATWVISARAV